MSTFYVTELQVDKGEIIHIKSEVEPVCEQEIPFTIEDARWALKTSDEAVLSEGECEITDHQLDALVSFPDNGTFYLWFIYNIADETWVDKAKIKVG